MEIELFKVLAEYPFVCDDVSYDGSVFPVNKTCIKCSSKDCLIMHRTTNEYQLYRCSKKYDCICLTTSEHRFMIQGLIFSDNNEISENQKNARQVYIIQKKYAEQILKRINSVKFEIANQIKSNIEKNFGVFHDIKTSLGLVQFCAEKFISEQRGRDFTEKLYNSPISIHDLYDSLKLVNSQLGLIDVMINPSSITQGEKRNFNMFKMFDRMKNLFKYKADKKDVTIRIEDFGKMIPNTRAYESFDFIPIILLDNAIKYSNSGATIMIYIEKINSSIMVKVVSSGPVIPLEERSKVFEKYFRGKNSVDKPGIGMGLWIAKQVLIRHGGDISYEVLSGNSDSRNCFKFNI